MDRASSRELDGRFRLFVANALITLAYGGVGCLTLLVADPPGYATAVWPAAGIALASVVVAGTRVWPGVFLGSFIVTLWRSFDPTDSAAIGPSLAVASAIGAGATLQALVGARLVRRFARAAVPFSDEWSVLAFLALGGPVASLVSATVGISSLRLAGIVSGADFGPHWLTWWIGDSLGTAVFAPLVLLWAAAPTEGWRQRQLQVSLPLVASFAVAVVLFVFANRSQQVLAGAFLFTGILEAFLLLLTGRAGRIEELVAHRTLAFERANRDLQQQMAERRKAESALRARQLELEQALRRVEAGEERFRGFVESAPDAIVIVDESGAIVVANAQTEAVFGYSRQEIIGRPVEVLLPERFRNAHLAHRAAYAANRKVRPMGAGLELHARRKDGVEIPVEVSLSPLQTEQGALIVSAIRDVTERKRAEEARMQLAAIVESSVDAIHGKTLDGTITSWNAAAEKLYGYTASEILGRSVDVLLPPDRPGEVRNLLERIGKGERISQFETVRLRKDGSAVEVSLTISPIFDRAGGIAGASTITRDITEHRKYDAELKRARDAALESARLKSAFLANMSHEIRTPLNVILGHVGLLEESIASTVDETQATSFAAIRSGGQRLLDTIGSVLDMSKIESGAFKVQPERIEVAKLVEAQANEIRGLATAKGLRVSTDIEVQDAVIRFDRYCLVNALANLLDNAVKFTQAGEIRLSLHRGDDGGLRLRVSDTGLGIDTRFLPHLFQPFSQEESGSGRRFEGSGLGLALVKRYLELNQAQVGVDSEKGRGTTFTISFSRASEMPSVPASSFPIRGASSS